MIKRFCDVCGRELHDDYEDAIEIKLYINDDKKHDLCHVCTSQFDSIVFGFLEGEIRDDDDCLHCKYCEYSIDEEPCVRCSHQYVNKFKRRNVRENNNEDDD